MQELPPKAGHPLFISPLKELAVGHFHWAEIGGTGRYQVITGRSTPSVRCSGVGHVSSLNLVSVSNGYLQNTGRFAGPHRTCPVHTGLKLREVCKYSGSPDALTGLIPREFRKTPAHRTLSTELTQVRPVHSATPDSTPEASSASGPASGDTLTTFPNFPPAQ